MNLYEYHSIPEQLTRYGDREMIVPSLILKRAQQLGRRMPEAECYLHRSPKYTYRYARFVVRGEYPEGEAVLANNPTYACFYACNVLFKRWPLAEPIIMTRSYSAFLYAKYVIQDRWLEAEPYIRMNERDWRIYERDIINRNALHELHMNMRNYGWEV